MTIQVFDRDHNPIEARHQIPSLNRSGETGLFDQDGYAVPYRDLPGSLLEEPPYEPTPEERLEAAHLLANGPAVPRSAKDLAGLLAGFLTTLGLEPEHHGNPDALYFQFLGRTTRLELYDVQREYEHYDAMYHAEYEERRAG